MTEPTADYARPLPIGGLTLPSAVAAATRADAAPAPGQLVRARWGEVSRFVLLIRAVEEGWLVAPVTLDPELATDEAYLVDAEGTDFKVPVAVWLDLATTVPPVVLERHVGQLQMSMSELRRSPTGRPVRTPLDERAMERAVLRDDLADLAAGVAPQERTLAELLGGLDVARLEETGVPTARAFVLLRGERPVTEEEAAMLAPLAGVSAAELIAAGPHATEEEVRRVLEDSEVAPLMRRLAERSGQPVEDVAGSVVQKQYALAARETGTGATDVVARLVQYLKALLGDE